MQQEKMDLCPFCWGLNKCDNVSDTEVIAYCENFELLCPGNYSTQLQERIAQRLCAAGGHGSRCECCP